MEPTKKESIIKNIKKTGFILEFKVSRILQQEGWTVINNKYYIDIDYDSAREIDILAYKATSIKDTRYYTTLLISCKKSEDKDWAFLTKDMAKNDPNIEYLPIYNWTNNKYVNYMLKHTNWKKEIESDYKTKPFLRNIYAINKNVYAWQEMAKSNQSVQNDKAIYSSVSCLTNAYCYEIGLLDQRIGYKAFYNFNLISIADTDLIEIYLKAENNIDANYIEEIKHINKYIVGKKEETFRIHFIKYDAFKKVLNEYNELHDYNTVHYSNLIEDFFYQIEKDEQKLDLYIQEVKYSFFNVIYLDLSKQFDIRYSEYNFLKMGLDFHGTLCIDLSMEEYVYDFLNNSDTIKSNVSIWLKNAFKYNGLFFFDKWLDLPF